MVESDDIIPSAHPDDTGRIALLKSALAGVFGTVDDAVARQLLATSTTHLLQGGDRLVRQGDPGDSVFVIVQGRLEAFMDTPSGRRRLRVFGRGESVGELAILTGEPRSASVRAIRDTVVLVLKREAFLAVLQSHSDIAMRVLQTLASRLASPVPDHEAPTPTHAIALVLASNDPKCLRAVQDLAKTLGGLFRATTIERRTFEAACGPGASELGPSQVGYRDTVGWLLRQEEAHELIIYVGGPDLDGWARRCGRQADRIVVVAPADDDGSVKTLEDWLVRQCGERPDLILVHSPNVEFARDTARWTAPRRDSDDPLQPGRLVRIHHLRDQNSADLGRIARILAGLAVGLVLSGGGARGFAHLGVLKALRALHVPIDLVGGTSMGAILGAGVAMHLPPDEIAEGMRRFVDDARLARSFALPMVSFLSARRLEVLLEELGRGQDIEDLWLNFFAISTDLTDANTVVHRHGSLWRAVRASVSLPALLPPVLVNGHVLVDGGILDHMPIEQMRARNPGPVIAVEVGMDNHLDAAQELTECPPGWRVLLSRLPMARRIRVPLLANIITQSVLCSGLLDAQAAQAMADLVITPLDGRYRILDFKHHVEIAEAAYRSTMERAEEIDAFRDRFVRGVPR
jgi:predicted acylesterase/phospholipase RssA